MLRRLADTPFCVSGYDLVPFGKENVWNIYSGAWGLRPLVIYSGGVGKDISTELELATYFDCKIHLFDPSPTGVATMSREENRHPRISFLPAGLAASSGIVSFAPPENPSEGSFRKGEVHESSHSMQCVSLVDHAREHGYSTIDLLKLDIEGFEYEVFENVLNSGLDVRQICVEFHHFLPGHNSNETAATLALLQKNGFQTIYRNNSDWTFLKI